MREEPHPLDLLAAWLRKPRQFILSVSSRGMRPPRSTRKFAFCTLPNGALVASAMLMKQPTTAILSLWIQSKSTTLFMKDGKRPSNVDSIWKACS